MMNLDDIYARALREHIRTEHCSMPDEQECADCQDRMFCLREVITDNGTEQTMREIAESAMHYLLYDVNQVLLCRGHKPLRATPTTGGMGEDV